MNQIPDAGLLPITQPSPAAHPGAAAQFYREHPPRNAAAENEHNAGEAGAVRYRSHPTQLIFATDDLNSDRHNNIENYRARMTWSKRSAEKCESIADSNPRVQ